jgi:hypothetical protein
MISTPRGVGQSASSLLGRALSGVAAAAEPVDVAVAGEAVVVELDEVQPMYASTVAASKTATHALLGNCDIAFLS